MGEVEAVNMMSTIFMMVYVLMIVSTVGKEAPVPTMRSHPSSVWITIPSQM